MMDIEEFKQGEMDNLKRQFQKDLRSLIAGELKKTQEEKLKQEKKIKYQMKLKILEQEKLQVEQAARMARLAKQ